MNEVTTIIGNRIKERGVTLVFISRKIQMNPDILSKTLKGTRNLKADEFVRICRILDLLMIAAGQLGVEAAVEEKTVTLTNSQSYPFNNSQKTVNLSNTRTTTAYSVDVEVLEHSGDVGDVLISDKLLNGFKVRYDGSAKSATVKLIIKGGM